MKQVLYFIVISLLIGCNNNENNHGGHGYTLDSTISTYNGILLDSNKFCLPIKYYNDTNWANTNIDAFNLKVYSIYLNNFKAPILYNYYLGYDNYRFLWLRSFHRAVLITIKKQNEILINTKILKTRPNIWTTIYNPYGKSQSNGERIVTGQDLESAKKEYPSADSIILPNYKVEITFDTTYKLSQKQWNRFVGLIDSCDFWKSYVYKEEFGLDGADWILEGQNPDKYHYMIRWSPNGKYKICCEYLIKISAAKNEMIY